MNTDNKKAVNLFCSYGGSAKPLLQQESSRCSWAFLLSLAVSTLKFADFRMQKKSEYASICLYFSTILFVLYHILFCFVCRCKITTFISFSKIYSLQCFVDGFNLSDGCGVVVSTALSTPCYHYMYTIVRMALHYIYHIVRQKGNSSWTKGEQNQ